MYTFVVITYTLEHVLMEEGGGFIKHKKLMRGGSENSANYKAQGSTENDKTHMVFSPSI